MSLYLCGVIRFSVIRFFVLKGEGWYRWTHFTFKIESQNRRFELNLPACFKLKRKWQKNVLSSHLKETPKQYIEVYYRIFKSALFGEIF